MSQSSTTVRILPDVLAIRAAKDGERTALIVDGLRRLTFAEWESRSNAVAHGLLRAGLGKGERLALLFDDDDWIDYAVAYVAALKAGATTVHLSRLFPREELERRCDECRVTWLVHSADLTPPTRRHVLPIAALETDRVTPVEVELGGDDLAGIAYTAGTTAARPKAVRLPHRDHLYGFDPDRHRDYERVRYFLAPFPIGTTSSQNIILFALAGVPTVLLLSRFDPEYVCTQIEALGVDNMMITPGMAVDLVNSGAALRHDLSSVRDLASGAAAISATMLQRLARQLPNAKITQFYLSAETVPAMAAMPFDPQRPLAVGKVAGGSELSIRDELGRDLRPGEVGEIWMSHPSRIRSYEAAADHPATFHGQWVRTGDLGHLDEEGYLYFFDRVADAIQTGQRRSSTLRIEDVLYQHEDVLEATVVGIPHPELGQVPAAAVVLRPGTDTAGLAAFARQRLNELEVPRRFIAQEYLPRGVIGKVLKREVRRWFDPVNGERALEAHRRRQVHYW